MGCCFSCFSGSDDKSLVSNYIDFWQNPRTRGTPDLAIFLTCTNNSLKFGNLKTRVIGPLS